MVPRAKEGEGNNIDFNRIILCIKPFDNNLMSLSYQIIYSFHLFIHRDTYVAQTRLNFYQCNILPRSRIYYLYPLANRAKRVKANRKLSPIKISPRPHSMLVAWAIAAPNFLSEPSARHIPQKKKKKINKKKKKKIKKTEAQTSRSSGTTVTRRGPCIPTLTPEREIRS
ncbi:hypothetical protein PUN28_001933 [Cardiocondyla obscurior]|uniref:Uncharacterized protein n=1 Tax=Cardiocondyla obscurior TaxID=286306 RepID=A0AAW2GRS6_9HYME